MQMARRVEHQDGKCYSSLMAAKSKVSPAKPFVLFKSYLLDVCYYPQNKVKDLVIVSNGQACSLLIDGHNSSDLQLANCGCAACKHWQRPSCIYQSICSQLYLCW